MVTLSMLLQTYAPQLVDSFKREDGQGFGEYAFLFGLVVLVVALALTGLATGLTNLFDDVSTTLAGML